MGEEEKRICRSCEEEVEYSGEHKLAVEHTDIESQQPCAGSNRPTKVKK